MVILRIVLLSLHHRREQKFSGAHVCIVTFKHLPKPLRSHIRGFGTLKIRYVNWMGYSCSTSWRTWYSGRSVDFIMMIGFAVWSKECDIFLGPLQDDRNQVDDPGRRSWQRKVIWFNPPWSSNGKTNQDQCCRKVHCHSPKAPSTFFRPEQTIQYQEG